MSNTTGESIITDATVFQDQITQLIAENEACKQAIHVLEGKLQISSSMVSEVQENNESLEQLLVEKEIQEKQKIQELDDKHEGEKNEMLNRLNDVEKELFDKCIENRELKETLRETNGKLQSLLSIEPAIDINQTEDTQALQDQIEDLSQKLSDTENHCQHLQSTISDMTNEISELRDILKETKNQLSEKAAALESTRDELAECRMEISALKVTPASDTCKGNSLFAEVEDRRLKVYDTMNAMKQSYIESKRAMQSKNAEIKALKAKQAALLNQLTSNHNDAREENLNLMEKYKNLISELQNKLKTKRTIINQLETKLAPKGDAYSFFLAELEARKKKIEDLEVQLENISIQSVLQEEVQNSVQHQLRYWRNKAMTSQAQIVAVKSCLEVTSMLEKSEILNILQENTNNSIDEGDLDMGEQQLPEESVLSIEKLITIPKAKVPECLDKSTVIRENLSGCENEQSVDGEFTACEPQSSLTRRLPVGDTGLEFTGGNPSRVVTTSAAEIPEKEKKILRFSQDTVERPRAGRLLRQETPKHPIICVSDDTSDN